MSVLNFRRGLFRLWLVFTVPWVSYFAWNGFTAYEDAKAWGGIALMHANRVVEMKENEESAPEFSAQYATKEYYRERAAQYRKERDDATKTAHEAGDEFRQAYTFGPTIPLGLLVVYFAGIFVARGFTQGRDRRKTENPASSPTMSIVKIENSPHADTREQLSESGTSSPIPSHVLQSATVRWAGAIALAILVSTTLIYFGPTPFSQSNLIYLILSFMVTWTVILIPPAIIRLVRKKPLTKRGAVATSFLLYFINFFFFSAMGSESKGHAALVLGMFFTYQVLRWETGASNPLKRTKAAFAEIERELPGAKLVRQEVLDLLSDPQWLEGSGDLAPMEPKVLAYFLIKNVAIARLSSGDNHIYRGVLSLPGTQLSQAFSTSSRKLVELGFHDEEAHRQDMMNLRKVELEGG